MPSLAFKALCGNSSGIVLCAKTVDLFQPVYAAAFAAVYLNGIDGRDSGRHGILCRHNGDRSKRQHKRERKECDCAFLFSHVGKSSFKICPIVGREW